VKTARTERIELDSYYVSERAKNAMQSAIAFLEKGEVHLAAQLAARESQRSRKLRYASVLLALEAVELLLAGAVSITTPQKIFSEEHRESWGPFYLRSYPEGAVVDLEILEEGDAYMICGKWRRAASFDPLVGVAVQLLAEKLSQHLGVVVGLDG
jgi:hypothetical protein